MSPWDHSILRVSNWTWRHQILNTVYTFCDFFDFMFFTNSLCNLTYVIDKIVGAKTKYSSNMKNNFKNVRNRTFDSRSTTNNIRKSNPYWNKYVQIQMKRKICRWRRLRVIDQIDTRPPTDSSQHLLGGNSGIKDYKNILEQTGCGFFSEAGDTNF